MTEEKKTSSKTKKSDAAKKKSAAPKTKKEKPQAKKKSSAKSRIPKLNEVQQEFVENKIKALGSLKAVENFYTLDDKVTKYALLRAKELFGKS